MVRTGRQSRRHRRLVLEMVISKEMCEVMIALHQSGLVCKEIASKGIALERTIYHIKNFREV